MTALLVCLWGLLLTWALLSDHPAGTVAGLFITGVYTLGELGLL
jgi:hypothetical protein